MLLVINGRVSTVRCGWEMFSPNTGSHRIQAPLGPRPQLTAGSRPGVQQVQHMAGTGRSLKPVHIETCPQHGKGAEDANHKSSSC